MRIPFDDISPSELQGVFDKFFKALEPKIIYDNQFKLEPGYTELSERDQGMFVMLKIYNDMETSLAFKAIQNMNRYVAKGILDKYMNDAYKKYSDLNEFQKGCFIMMLTTYANHINELNEKGDDDRPDGMVVIVIGKGPPPFM